MKSLGSRDNLHQHHKTAFCEASLASCIGFLSHEQVDLFNILETLPLGCQLTSMIVASLFSYGALCVSYSSCHFCVTWTWILVSDMGMCPCVRLNYLMILFVQKINIKCPYQCWRVEDPTRVLVMKSLEYHRLYPLFSGTLRRLRVSTPLWICCSLGAATTTIITVWKNCWNEVLRGLAVFPQILWMGNDALWGFF